MKDIINNLQPKLVEVFKYLHEYPEISWQEHRTTKYIQNLLSSYNCKITTFDNITGLVAEIGQGKPVIALRADIDALWQEVDGIFQPNHSCGHDAHMTIAIGVFLTMIENGLPANGTFRFIFQPAEEKGTGALALVEKNIINDVDFLYGMHLRPIEELDYGQFSPVIEHGAAKFISGIIKGEDAHGARPHLNTNAIQIGADFFQHLNNIQINPMIPHSVKMTAFHAGGKNTNIIPGNATFSIDIRAQTNEVMEELTEKIYRLAKTLADYYQTEITLTQEAHIAAAIINEEAIAIMEEAITECVGKEKLVSKIRTTGGDDFHFYSLKRPHLKATMLGIGCDLAPGLHHPNMTFNQKAIPLAVQIITKALIKTANRY